MKNPKNPVLYFILAFFFLMIAGKLFCENEKDLPPLPEAKKEAVELQIDENTPPPGEVRKINITKICEMIKKKQASDKEADFYEKLEE